MKQLGHIAGGATALGLVLALQTGSAQADTTARILDAPLISPEYSRIETWISSSSGAGSAQNSWGDELGGGSPFDGFRSGAIDITWTTGGNVEFTLYTNFGLSGTTVGGLFVGFADLFIDVGNDGSDWDYAVDFKSESEGQTSDNGENNAAELVSNPTFATSQQIVGGTSGLQYGGRTNICSGSNDAACQTGSRIPETKVTNNSTYTLDVAWTDPATLTGPDGSQDYGAAYTVVLENVNLDGSWNELEVFWGTGWCANDTIEGTAVVPIPAALPMLLAAVGGLGFAGWRRQRRA